MRLHELHIGQFYLTMPPDEPLFVLGQEETPVPGGIDPEELERERLHVLEGLKKTIEERRNK